MKKRFEIYLDDEGMRIVETIKEVTGYMKPGMAIVTALNGYLRSLQQIKRLTKENAELRKKMCSLEKREYL